MREAAPLRAREARALERMVFAGLWDKVKGLLPANAWDRVKGRLRKLKDLFAKAPTLLSEMSKVLFKGGAVTPSALEGLAKQGREVLSKALGGVRQFMALKKDLPTLTDLIKRTAFGAGILDKYEQFVKPKADALEVWLKKHLPTLTRVAVAALFIWIWLNVDELSWKPDDILRGFTGQISLADLLLSLPESGIGAISSALFGAGYTIMPYVLAARLMWMLAHKYLEYNGGKWKPNFKLVDKSRFDQGAPA
jgi:hypothetical protein